MNAENEPMIALNVDCLAVREHTGIANLAKAFAKEMLEDSSINPMFFMLRAEVPRDIVEKLVELNGGDLLWWLAKRLNGSSSLSHTGGTPKVAIYPGLKGHRRLFPMEVQVIHDCTVFVTPEFHTAETAKFWEERMLADMLSSDLLVARSESTLVDLRTYFPQVSRIPCVVATGAPDAGNIEVLHNDVSSYVVVLGTLEPRKNIAFILNCLAEHPHLADTAKFVFIGRWGWGSSTQEQVERFGLSKLVEEGRIVFTGFVSDRARDQLIAAARLVVYVSRYEGLGLPVIEALRFGTPVLTSYSSSLPEVGGDVAHYCDIDSSESFFQVVNLILADGSADERNARIAWADQFAFGSSYRRIRDAALEIARSK